MTMPNEGARCTRGRNSSASGVPKAEGSQGSLCCSIRTNVVVLWDSGSAANPFASDQDL